MLLDAVGSFWDDGYNYYLKHRATGQVDEEGKPTSTVLGAVDIKGEWDAFSFKVSGADRDVDFGPYLDLWDGDIDWGVSDERSLWAIWTYSRRAILYKDYEMREQIGWLDITGSGTWYEWEEERVVHDTDEDGEVHVRYEYDHHSECKTNAFQYKFNVYNTPMNITYRKTGGGFFKAKKLDYTACNAFAPDMPLFRVIGDGENNATVETFENSDPVSTLLAAYAISCKLDPSDFKHGATKQCRRHISLGMRPGTSNFIGMDQARFEKEFSYPAPPMPCFAAQVAAYVPPPQPQMFFGQPGMPAGQMMQPVVQPQMVQPQMMAQPMQMQPGMAMAQPGMQPGMVMAQPGMVMAQPGMQMMQPGMAMAQPMQMQPGMAMAQPMAQPGYGSNY